MRTLLLLLLLSGPALAQGLPPYPRPSREVVAYPPDGGVEVFVPGRVDTNITNTYVPVAGGAGGERLEVSLDTATLNTITSATALGNCTYTVGDPTATIDTTAANIPVSPMTGRTAMTIWNYSNNHTLICSPNGTATTTHGHYIYGDGQWWKWEGLGGGVTISCKCLSGTCTYSYLEERCYQ